jgi:O-antigen/teichoic acid export membrane protein
VAVNLTLNAALIPTIGVKGAAIAAVATEAVLVTYYLNQLRPVLGWPRVGSRLAIGGIGLASFWGLFSLLPPLSLLVVIPGSILIYLATLLLIKDVRRNEVEMFKAMLKRGA